MTSAPHPTQDATSPTDDTSPLVQRAILLLGISYALGWFAVALAVGPGSAAFVELSGRLDAAGYYIALYFVGVALGSALFGRAMDRWGRRALAVAHTTAALGFALAGFAVRTRLLWMFAAGDVVLAFGAGGIFLTRVAAAELVPPSARGRAVARIQLGALAGALAGPLLLVVSASFGTDLEANVARYVWFIAPAPLLAAALLALLSPETHSPAGERARTPAGAASAAVSARSFPLRPVLTGAASLALAQASMVMAMGVTGAALTHQGHGVSSVGYALASHFTGMFALSTVVGRFADRAGRRLTILTGFSLMIAGGVLMASVPGVTAFSAAIFLVGLGWSFAYIGGTLLVTDSTPPGRTARTLGLSDMVAAGVTIAASLGGGAWYAARGLPGLGLLAAAMVVLPAISVLTLEESRLQAPNPAR